MMAIRLREVANKEETKLVTIASLRQSRLFQETIAVDIQGVMLIINSMTHLIVQPTVLTPEADAETDSPGKARSFSLTKIEQTVFCYLRYQIPTYQAEKTICTEMKAREINICRAQGEIL